MKQKIWREIKLESDFLRKKFLICVTGLLLWDVVQGVQDLLGMLHTQLGAKGGTSISVQISSRVITNFNC